jgi:hypothetical protein
VDGAVGGVGEVEIEGWDGGGGRGGGYLVVTAVEEREG